MKRLVEGVDYYIYFMNFPPMIFSCCTPNPDGTFTIYLDPRRSFYQRSRDLEHELNHIRNNDFYNGLPIQLIEDYL